MERISKIQALPDIGRDFIGVAGQHDTSLSFRVLRNRAFWLTQ